VWPGSGGSRRCSDIYALGAVGYFMLTGEHVFSGNTVVEIAGHHLHTEPDPPSRRLGQGLPADLEAVLLECLRKDQLGDLPEPRRT
jgi:eukaryotic-like serine/threonine-protein kinase